MGKRTGCYGGFLLGCYDAENEEYQSLCKIGTGFKDEDLAAHWKFFQVKTFVKPFALHLSCVFQPGFCKCKKR